MMIDELAKYEDNPILTLTKLQKHHDHLTSPENPIIFSLLLWSSSDSFVSDASGLDDCSVQEIVESEKQHDNYVPLTVHMNPGST